MLSLVNCIEFLKFNFFFTSTPICFFHSFFYFFILFSLSFVISFGFYLLFTSFFAYFLPSFLFICFILLSYIDLSSNLFFFVFILHLIHCFAACFLNLFKLPSHLFFHSSFFFSFLSNITNTQLLFFCFLLNLRLAILILSKFSLVFYLFHLISFLAQFSFNHFFLFFPLLHLHTFTYCFLFHSCFFFTFLSSFLFLFF